MQAVAGRPLGTGGPCQTCTMHAQQGVRPIEVHADLADPSTVFRLTPARRTAYNLTLCACSAPRGQRPKCAGVAAEARDASSPEALCRTLPGGRLARPPAGRPCTGRHAELAITASSQGVTGTILGKRAV